MKILFILFIASLPMISWSQKTVTNSKVNLPKIEKMTFEQYCEANAVYLIDVPAEKAGSLTYTGELKLSGATTNLNYKNFGIVLLEGTNQYFKLVDSDKILVAQSLYVLRLNYANSQK